MRHSLLLIALTYSIVSSPEAAAQQAEVKTSGGDVIKIDYERLSKSYDVSNIKLTEGEDYDDILGKVVKFKRVTFSAKSKHDRSSTGFWHAKMLDSDGDKFYDGYVEWPGIGGLIGGPVKKGESVKGVIQIREKKPAKIRIEEVGG